MTEDEAQAWITARFGDRIFEVLDTFLSIVRAQSAVQNLVSQATLEIMWARHITDSAQLIHLAPASTRSWLDIGTGAGFPGLVVGLATTFDMMLCEPRRRRAEFLRDVIRAREIEDRVSVAACKIEALPARRFDVISARAVASIDDLFAQSRHCAGADTCYILPRGRHAAEELETAKQRWHGMFHVEQSITDPASGIVIARQVRAR